MSTKTEQASRFRWWLWRLVTRSKRVCPANAHSRLIWRIRDQPIGIDDVCRRDAAACGVCWCGKIDPKGALR